MVHPVPVLLTFVVIALLGLPLALLALLVLALVPMQPLSLSLPLDVLPSMSLHRTLVVALVAMCVGRQGPHHVRRSEVRRVARRVDGRVARGVAAARAALSQLRVRGALLLLVLLLLVQDLLLVLNLLNLLLVL